MDAFLNLVTWMQWPFAAVIIAAIASLTLVTLASRRPGPPP